MCLAPIQIYTTARKVSRSGGQPFRLTIPCGHCAECLKRKADEYMLRSYYQTFETFNKGGIVYFDTLTYAPEHRPLLNQFFNDVPPYPCFSRRDIRLFFVRLRRNLTRLGFDVANNFSYFLSSEYGTSENGQHCPHYHIVCHSTIANLDPYTLSMAIAQAWQLGRTDGLPFKSKAYVARHTFGRGFSNDLVHAQNVCRYVSKYVITDSDYQKVINLRLNGIMRTKFGDDWHDSLEARQLFNALKRNFCQFHLNSKGYGASALLHNDNLNLIKSQNLLRMPCSKDIVKFVPLPMYFARKVFYEMKEDWRGLRAWFKTDEGKLHYLEHYKERVELMSTGFKEWYQNLPSLCQSIEQGMQVRSQVDDLLKGRSFDSFAEYLFTYRGRIMDKQSYHEVKNHVFDPSRSLDSWLVHLLEPDSDPDAQTLYNYSTSLDKYWLGCAFLHSQDLGDPSRGYTLPVKTLEVLHDFINAPHVSEICLEHGDAITQGEFFTRYCFHSGCCDAWQGFDELFNLYTSSLTLSNLDKQKAFDTKEKLKAKYKAMRAAYNINSNSI